MEAEEYHFFFRLPINSVWEALEMKAQSSEKFKDVSDVKVTDQDGYLSHDTIRANLNEDSQQQDRERTNLD